MKSLYLRHQNLIHSFIYYYEYGTYDNDPIVDDCMKIANDDFNDFHMKYYYNFRRFCESELVNTIISVNTENKFISPVRGTIINKD